MDTILKSEYHFEKQLFLIIDAPFWAGHKSHWEKLMQADNGIIAMEDNMLAY